MNSGLAPVNGADLYFESMGSGHPLLLLHAGIADSRMWDTQFEVFSKEFHVIRFDLRGFGRSNMPTGKFANLEDVRGLLDYLDVGSAHVLGISFGGMIALDLALAHPDYVDSLVLAAPSVSGARPSARIREFWAEEQAALDAGDVAAATELNLRLWVDGPQRDPGQVRPEVREKVRAMQSAIFLKDIPDDIEELDLEPPAKARLGDVNVPVLVMVGALDLVERLELSEDLANQIPHRQRLVIPNAAHMLNMEAPDVFNRSVLDFLSQC